MNSRPSFQIYPGDELRSPVSGCSLAAQGLWFRMRLLMHDSDRYGYLYLNGSAMQAETIARRCGSDLPQYETLVEELARAGILFRSNDGSIYCKTMVERERERVAEVERKRKEREKKQGPPDVKSLSEECPEIVREMSDLSSTSISSSRVIEKEKVKKRKSRGSQSTASPSPESMPITPEMQLWAEEKEILGEKVASFVDLPAETERFLDHHRKKGDVFSDWVAAWRNWMRNAVEFKKKNKFQTVPVGPVINHNLGKYDNVYET